ncbi:MAG TPA: copper resistance protein B [Steroidobacteraceae bacterium]|nr:copper resistance protein B [Steroidobacteraceae bacterium]
MKPRYPRYLAFAGLLTAINLIAQPPCDAQSVEGTGGDPTSPFGPAMEDNRIYTHVLLDELEGRFGSTDAFRWDGESWVGTDINRLWIKSEGFALPSGTQDGDQEFLYDRPISPFFDLQGGVRYDLDSSAARGWAALGVEGLAPYLFELSVTLYASDAGHFAAKLQASYDELLTQRWILQPLIEINAYSRADPARDVGAGFSDIDAGLRLRYEISRKFAPYFGVTYQRAYGPAPHAGLPAFYPGPEDAWRLAIGARVWL